ncbi:MAG: hypothetical protein AAF724_22300 [Pseudomonadota bacterium]
MSNSFFSNALNRISKARERQARRYVDNYLLSLDDETLKSLGHTREDIYRGRRLFD